MNYQLAELICIYLKSAECFLIPVCTWNIATSGARPCGCVTSGGRWSSTAAPPLASPKPCLGASAPARCSTMLNLSSFRAGAKRRLQWHSLLSYLLTSSRGRRRGDGLKAPWEVREIDRAESIGGRVSSKTGRRQSGMASFEWLGGWGWGWCLPGRRLGRAGQLPLHLGAGGGSWPPVVALRSSAQSSVYLQNKAQAF